MAAKRKDRRETVPLRVGGMYSSGDAALIPAGFTRLQRNAQPGAGPVWFARPPFVSDLSVVNVSPGFFQWYDTTNRVLRLVAAYWDGINTKLRVKDNGAETYGSAVTGPNVGAIRVADHANYRGKAYYVVNIASDNSQRQVVAFDGSNTAANAYLFGLRPQTVTTYIDRLFFGGGSFSILNALGFTDPYSTASWTLTNTTSQTITNGADQLVRITPTNATASVALSPSVDAESSVTSGGEIRYTATLRGVSSVYAMPITLQLVVNNTWQGTTLYIANTIITPTTGAATGFCYKSQNAAATTGGAEPAWPVTIGGTVVDGGVTWTCISTTTIGTSEFTIPLVSEQPGEIGYEVIGRLPVPYGSTRVSGRVAFGNTATPSITTNIPIDFSYRDGLADGTTGKKNWGHQITLTAFALPFFNQESAALAVIDNGDTVFWSEPGDPSDIRGANFYRLRDTAGRITAATAGSVGSRIAFFKRSSTTTFIPNETDPDNPLIREKTYGVGALGSRAIITYDAADGGGTIAFGIGEDFVWSWRPGSGEFEDLCGDEMRDEIMDKSPATWVESQSTYNVPLVAFDRNRKILYVYTQKGKIHGYRQQTKEWFRYDVNDAGFEVLDMFWSPTTGKLYVSWGGQQISRLDHSVSNQGDAVNNSGTTYPVVSQTDIPIEFRGPQLDVILDRVNAYIKANADQTGQVFYVYVSTDQGATFTLYNEITLPVSNAFTRVPIDLYQMQPSFIVRLQKEGNGGAANYMLSSAEAEINIMSGAWQRNSPTQLGSSLT